MSDVDPITIALLASQVSILQVAAKHGLKQLTKYLKEEYVDAGPKAVGEVMADNYRDYGNQYGQELAWLIPRVLENARNENELRERIEELAANGTTKRILATFAFEAMRETLPERREMLAAAAAMLTLSDWPIERKASAERVLRQLDPTHVMALCGLSHVCTKWFHGNERSTIEHVRHETWRYLPYGEVLEMAGCVRVVSSPQGFHALEITNTGLLVLQTLADYTSRRPYPMDVPGREAPTGARPEPEARAFFEAQVPGLVAKLRLLARKCRRKDPHSAVRYDYPGWGRRFQTPALPGALEAGNLFFDHVDEAEAKAIEAQKPFHSVNHEQARIERKFPDVVAKADQLDPGRWTLKVYGPHDVMMHIAKDVDAVWNQTHHQHY